MPLMSRFAYAISAGLALSAIAITPGNAAVINYTEGTDLNHTDLGILGIGSNTITGRAGVQGDDDAFTVHLAAGDEITSVAISITNASGTPALNASGLISHTNAVGTGTLFSGSILGPGDGNFDLLDIPFPMPGSFNYSLTINVSAADTPVPEPASIALLGTALVGFGAFRHRRRKAV